MTALTRPMPRRVSRWCPAQDKVLNDRLRTTDCGGGTPAPALRPWHGLFDFHNLRVSTANPQRHRDRCIAAVAPEPAMLAGKRGRHAALLPRRDRSLRRAAKRRRRTRMMHVRGPIRHIRALKRPQHTLRRTERLIGWRNQAILPSSGRLLGECRVRL